MTNPLKQGLKPYTFGSYPLADTVVMTNPLKQGLKHSKARDARKPTQS